MCVCNIQFLTFYPQPDCTFPNRPPTDTTVLNFNLFNAPVFSRLARYAMTYQKSAISPVLNTESMFGAAAPQSGEHPQSILVHPVSQDFHEDSPVVGHTIAVITWRSILENLLPAGQPVLEVVLRESCGAAFTYRIDGPNAIFVGLGDLHDTSYDDLKESSDFLHNSNIINKQDDADIIQDHCEYTIEVYPTAAYEDYFQTKQPVVFTAAVILIFAFASAVFIAYSCLVDQRQKKVHDTAVRAKSIVNSLFPGQVGERLQEERAHKADKWTTENVMAEESEIVEHNQLAEFYPSATILFADIAGFTAWSSVREPQHVFVLLETLYKAFDSIANKRKVFKVETIGDCYVAVCGLPNRKSHCCRSEKFWNASTFISPSLLGRFIYFYSQQGSCRRHVSLCRRSSGQDDLLAWQTRVSPRTRHGRSCHAIWDSQRPRHGGCLAR